MSLFNYKECDLCKRRGRNEKLALCNVLLANVCNMIGEYVNDCWRCEGMKEKEKDFIDENTKMTKPEIQLYFFRTFHKSFLKSHRTSTDRNGKQFKKTIDRIFD